MRRLDELNAAATVFAEVLWDAITEDEDGIERARWAIAMVLEDLDGRFKESRWTPDTEAETFLEMLAESIGDSLYLGGW